MASEYLKWKYRDVKPRETKELTPAEKRKNWWHYHKWHVATAVVLLGIGASLIAHALGFGQVRPDYQVAYVGEDPLPDGTAAAIESAFAALGVDLNGDGTEEILAVVMGPYTSGTGGSSMLWVLPYADMAVNQAFTLMNTPIIVTKEAANGQDLGAKGLIVQRSGGGGETEFVLLTCSGGIYKGAGNGEVLDSLDGVEGIAIICNDLAADMESGGCLTLTSTANIE